MVQELPEIEQQLLFKELTQSETAWLAKEFLCRRCNKRLSFGMKD
jgi:hypothetical protein